MMRKVRWTCWALAAPIARFGADWLGGALAGPPSGLGCGVYLGKALRLVSRYSLRPFCTRSSNLLQSLRLSSSLWSEHTLITCRNQTQPGRE